MRGFSAGGRALGDDDAAAFKGAFDADTAGINHVRYDQRAKPFIVRDPSDRLDEVGQRRFVLIELRAVAFHE